MDVKVSAIRHVLTTTDPPRAERIVRSFRLPREEEACIIRHEIHGESLVQIATELSVSPETVKRRRRSGFLKIADTLNV